jgi:hypothetical protein
MEPVLVTTTNRGVFFGYLATPADDASPAHITLKNARNAVYWDTATKGFLALAVEGPSAACKVGPAVPELTLQGVSSVAVCTPEAAVAWELGPWAED